ncbi:putative Pentatricopeptide repeat-containing protein [Zostera marina]|uniref:Putative Pentatricopeptide repeat-containing protein n=1 Tax=Zostera marina TaxID=29655 RepID=A0A0K9Q2U5_ZOSMR|nr:putative Pentatricopeptide repeat-containing protein [Zostera marina]
MLPNLNLFYEEMFVSKPLLSAPFPLPLTASSPIIFRPSPSFFTVRNNYQKQWRRIPRLNPPPKNQHSHQFVDRSVDMKDLLASLHKTTNPEQLQVIMSPYAETGTNHRISLRFVVSLLAKDTDWRRSIALLDWMLEKANYPPSVFAYNVVLRNVLRASEWDVAAGLLHEMVHERNLSPDRYTYATLISALGKAGHLEAALHWLQRMEKDGVSADLVLYSSIIELARKLRDYSKAISLFSRMRRSGISPDLVAYNSMINVFGKAGLLREARSLLDEMTTDSSASPSVSPDTVSYSTLLTAFVDNKRYVEALSLFSEMRDRRVDLDLTTCNIMIDVYGQLGMAREADRLFWSMRKLGIDPSAVSYNTLLRVYGEAELFGEAIHLFRLMQKKEVEQNVVTYNTMMQIYGKSLEHEKAGNLIQEMQSIGVQPNTITYATLISIWAKSGKLERAAMLFQKLRTTSGIEIDKVLYQTMISSYERAGLVGHAKRLLHDLKHPGEETGTGRGVSKETAISILASTGRVEEATRLFRVAIESGELKDINVFRSMMEVLSRNKRHGNVVEVFEKMRGAGYFPDSDMIGTAMNAYGKLQEIGKADGVYRELQEEGCVFSDQVHFQMLSLLGGRRDFKGMERLLKKLDSEPNIDKKGLHLVAASIYERSNRLDDAARIMAKIGTRSDHFI